jgi:uncharacterized protein (DUF1778 family)
MRKPTTFRLKESIRSLLDTMAAMEDVSRTAMLEAIVKEAAKQRKIDLPTKSTLQKEIKETNNA